MSTEFTVGDHTYSARRLDAFTQLHVGRRLAPLLGYITAAGGNFASVVEALSAAPQADVDYIVRNTLKSVKRKSGEAWADVYNQTAEKLVFEDIDGLHLLEIVSQALQGDIVPFFSGLVKRGFDINLSSLTSATSATPTTTS